jgi:ankyrin repeat protein
LASPERDRARAAFFEAIRNGDRKAVEAALAADAGLLAARDERSRSAVMAAAYAGQVRLAELLAERADPDELSLFEAAATGHVAAVRRRLESGSEIEDHADDGYTALHFAAYFGQLEVARMLLERGADPNAVAQNASRVTPLHSAVAGRHRDLAGLLLALGSSANAVQQGGWTPLHAAAQNGDEATVGLLLLRGADASRPADDGRTAVDMAIEGGHAALAELLREAVRDGSAKKRRLRGADN